MLYFSKGESEVALEADSCLASVTHGAPQKVSNSPFL